MKRKRKEKEEKVHEDDEEEDDSIKVKKEKKKTRKKKHKKKEKKEKYESEDEEVQVVKEETVAKEDEEEEENEEKPNKEEEKSLETNEKKKKPRKRKRKKKDDKKDVQENEGDEDREMQEEDYEVYIEGIPYDCTEDDVRDFFESNGCSDIAEVRLPRWQDTGRLRGYGHIVFSSTSTRRNALEEVNGKRLQNRYISVQIPKAKRRPMNATARPQPPGCKTLFLKNLPYDLTSEGQISNVLQDEEEDAIEEIRMVMNWKTRQFKGFAYVTFREPEAAKDLVQRAASSKGIVMQGRRILADYDEGHIRRGYRTSDGRLYANKDAEY